MVHAAYCSQGRPPKPLLSAAFLKVPSRPACLPDLYPFNPSWRSYRFVRPKAPILTRAVRLSSGQTPPHTHTHSGKRDTLIRQDFPGGFRWPPRSQGQRPDGSVGPVNAPPHTLELAVRAGAGEGHGPRSAAGQEGLRTALLRRGRPHSEGHRGPRGAWHVAAPPGAGCWGICSCISRMLCAARKSRGSFCVKDTSCHGMWG